MTSPPPSSSVLQALEQAPPPDPLPVGWILRHSRSQPGVVYYYNQETGESTWEQPIALIEQVDSSMGSTAAAAVVEEESLSTRHDAKDTVDEEVATTTTIEETAKRPLEDTSSSRTDKRSKSVKEVRVLHILKKHKDSRRPSSWRQPNITITQQEAVQELQELLSILKESQTPLELKATMEELARTESDCSSAKRGGDLGFFGRKKMQPAFEQASFGLEIGELSGVVETSSGVHIILRVG